MIRLACVAALALALTACFNPTYDNPQCGPAGECPSGFDCVQGVCRSDTAGIDAPPGDADIDAGDPDADDPDADIDGPPGPTCPTGALQSPTDPTRCFLPSTISADWETLRNHCQSMGGDLADILDSGENQLLDQLGVAVWLGGSDPNGQQNYTWARTGAPFTYTSWAGGEPNGSFFLPFCVLSRGSLWSDEPCNDLYVGLCVVPAV